MTDPDDAMREIGEALTTAIGTEEIALKTKYGNAGYEDLKKRQAAINWAGVKAMMLANDQAEAVIAQAKALEDFIGARAAFWRALTFAIVVAALCGVAVLVFWMVGA